MLDKLIAEVMQGMAGSGRAGATGGGSPLMQVILQLLAGGTGAGPQRGGDELGGLLSGLAGGARGAGANPLEGLIGAILGGGQAGGGGGLGDLLGQLQRSGLGREADSWVSRGPNLPVDPEQLTRTLGRDRLETLAQQHGMDVGEMVAGLSTELPQAVDELTPEGRLPQRDELAGLLAGLGGGRA